MTSRRLLPRLVVLLLAVVGLSGCVAIKTEGANPRAPGVVTISLQICAAQHTSGSNCNPNDRNSTAEPDNGADAFTGTAGQPQKGRLVVGFRVPTGSTAPDAFTSATGEEFTKSPGYTSSLNGASPPATGFVWFGYLSSSVTLTGGAPLTTLSVEFGLPAAADGSPFTGPFLWRAIVGLVGIDTTNPDPTACPTNPPSQFCFDSPPVANLGTDFQQKISDFRVMPATGATAAPGQTATLSYNVKYIDNAVPAFGARTFDLTGSSTLPGNPKVTPSAASLTNFMNNQTRPVTENVTVPAGTAPGSYPITLTATDHASGVVRSNTVTLTVVDKTPPSISIGSPTDGQVVQVGQQIAASYSCADETNGSGLASCSGPVANGAAIDTSTAGQKAFTVTATDKAGNQSSLTHTYTVQAPPPPPPPPPPVIVPVTRPQINFSLSFLYAASRKSTKFKVLAAKDVPKGSTVSVTCKGKGCPKKRYTKKNASGSVSLKPFVKKALKKGIVLTVSVTKTGAVGMVKTITITTKAPRITTACLQPGAKKASSCA